MSLPVQARCSGTASPYRQSPESLLLLLPALLQERDPGRGPNRALGSCCIWQCIPAEESLSTPLAIQSGKFHYASSQI